MSQPKNHYNKYIKYVTKYVRLLMSGGSDKDCEDELNRLNVQIDQTTTQLKDLSSDIKVAIGQIKSMGPQRTKQWWTISASITELKDKQNQMQEMLEKLKQVQDQLQEKCGKSAAKQPIKSHGKHHPKNACQCPIIHSTKYPRCNKPVANQENNFCFICDHVDKLLKEDTISDEIKYTLLHMRPRIIDDILQMDNGIIYEEGGPDKDLTSAVHKLIINNVDLEELPWDYYKYFNQLQHLNDTAPLQYRDSGALLYELLHRVRYLHNGAVNDADPNEPPIYEYDDDALDMDAINSASKKYVNKLSKKYGISPKEISKVWEQDLLYQE